MDETVKRDIISVLQQTLHFIEQEDFVSLKNVSNYTIGNASTLQDPDSVQIAVIIYALSKIMERAKEEHKSISKNIAKSLQRASAELQKNKEDNYRHEIVNLFSEISETDEKLLLYVQNVIDKAHIVKGSSIYGQGISIGRAAEILGINQWDLMSFVGKTRIADREPITDVKKRLAFAKKLFKVA
ncbi:MAG TPA: hypothetical protein VKE88_02740 [Candidatus Nanoarchaeia archaeon]|nr:hypothetical protein [Candidatus Nanoarchaeia archaeon]